MSKLSANEILVKIDNLTISNASLTASLDRLESDLELAQQHFKAEVAALEHILSSRLPQLTRLLQGETAPAARIGWISRIRNAIARITPRPSPTELCVKHVRALISDTRVASDHFAQMSEEARDGSVASADAAFRAARHADEVKAVIEDTDKMQAKARLALSQVRSAIRQEEAEILTNARLAERMGAEVRFREEQDNVCDRFITAGIIPFIGIPFVIGGLIGKAVHQSKRDDALKVQITARHEEDKAASKKDQLESTVQDLDRVKAELTLAFSLASNKAHTAQSMLRQGKSLTDKYGNVATAIDQVLDALSHVIDCHVSGARWETIRLVAIDSIQKMVTSLKDSRVFTNQLQ